MCHIVNLVAQVIGECKYLPYSIFRCACLPIHKTRWPLGEMGQRDHSRPHALTTQQRPLRIKAMKTCQQPCERRNKTVQAGAWTWSTTIRRQAAWRPGTSLAFRNLLRMRLLEGSWLLLEGSGMLVGRLWDASWKALGRLLEAFRRHLGPMP